ncbi:MAG: DUF952 domain-containing protein [Pyrinomonadaceae bacterium]
MFIYHIVLPAVWEQSKTRASYQPESLATEGFIHCSYPSQLEGVLKRYYSGADKVLILKIDTDKLLSKLVKEASTNDEIYPHIYGRLNHTAIVEVRERIIEKSGFEGF